MVPVEIFSYFAVLGQVETTATSIAKCESIWVIGVDAPSIVPRAIVFAAREAMSLEELDGLASQTRVLSLLLAEDGKIDLVDGGKVFVIDNVVRQRLTVGYS